MTRPTLIEWAKYLSALFSILGPIAYGLWVGYSYLEEWRRSAQEYAQMSAESDELWLAEDRAFRVRVLDRLEGVQKELATQTKALDELEVANITLQRMLADLNYRIGVLEGRRRAGEPGRVP